MTIRSRRETVTFRNSFRAHGIDRLLPAGSYQVIADEETIHALDLADAIASGASVAND
jgi:hypothetical protein